MTTPTTEQAVTASTLASDILRCSVETVYRMARTKQIPSIRLGREYRFFPSEVRAKLAAPPAQWTQSNRSRGRRRAA